MTWNDISEKLMWEALFNFSLGLLVLRLLIRPRKLKIIYNHFNNLITRVLFMPMLGKVETEGTRQAAHA